MRAAALREFSRSLGDGSLTFTAGLGVTFGFTTGAAFAVSGLGFEVFGLAGSTLGLAVIGLAGSTLAFAVVGLAG